jgi:cation transport regulator ChaC
VGAPPTWVFGYGSLVSPVSFGHTLGRELTPGVDFFEAEVVGYGRRWNYGTTSEFTAIDDRAAEPKRWTFVALGVVRSADETTNGVIGWVDDSELDALDARERYYDRVDVTTATILNADVCTAVDGAAIVTYVPQPEPIRWYESATSRGVAAITKRYWDLVDGAFADLGADRRERYHATTPAPDIPIVEQPVHEIPDRHRGRR